DGWQLYNMVTYLTLDKSTDLKSVAAKFDEIIEANIGSKLKKENSKMRTGFQPLTDIHLNPSFQDNFSNTYGSIQNLRFFGIIAIFILIIAWVNYINLSTAKAKHRAKEVGIRKSMGACKKQLISQFLFESFLINCLATILAVSIAFLLLPVLGQIIGKELAFTLIQKPAFLIKLVLIVLLGSALSGFCPAFVLSSFRPISTPKQLDIRPASNFSLRKGLIVFQFSTALILIASTYLIYAQIAFMKSKDLGVDMEKIVVVHGPRIILEEKKEIQTLQYKAFKDITTSHHSVASITSTSNIPGKGEVWYGGMRKLGDPIDVQKIGSAVLVDAEFTKTYDLEFLAGEELRPEMEPYSAVIINEEAVKVFNLGSPIDALDESIVMSHLDTLKIQGVIKNVHWSSLKDAHIPMIFGIHEFHAYFSIKINLSNIPETLAHIESAYRKSFPNDPFLYYFLEDDFNRQYQTDLQFGNLFRSFTIIAIFVACLGLYALLAFSATQRIKEIGIRKVLGASMSNLMLLLSKEYFPLLFVASALSVPLIFYFGNSWLENYAFRIEMGVEFFLVPALMLVVITLLTVSYHTYRTAKANPVESLRTE
ncbi:MAG: putative ABC transport system permease protein, partial [Cyclobacteriaceae bacterium]